MRYHPYSVLVYNLQEYLHFQNRGVGIVKSLGSKVKKHEWLRIFIYFRVDEHVIG